MIHNPNSMGYKTTKERFEEQNPDVHMGVYKHLCTVVAVSQTILTLQIMKLLIGYVGSTIYTLNN